MASETTCACTDCGCKVTEESAVTKDGQAYCSEACANGHPDGEGCGHEGCHCHG